MESTDAVVGDQGRGNVTCPAISEVQIVKLLREAHRTSVADLPNFNGVSEHTIYSWLKQDTGAA